MDSFERITCRVEYQLNENKLDCEGRSVQQQNLLDSFSTEAAAWQAAKNVGFVKEDRRAPRNWVKDSGFTFASVSRVLVEE